MNKENTGKIRVIINIVMMLLLILQIISLISASSQMTIFLGTLIVLCNSISISINAFAKKKETTDVEN